MVEGFEDTRGKPVSVLLYFIGVRISVKRSSAVSAMRVGSSGGYLLGYVSV